MTVEYGTIQVHACWAQRPDYRIEACEGKCVHCGARKPEYEISAYSYWAKPILMCASCIDQLSRTIRN